MGHLSHRTRNHKRRIRNLVLEIISITILIFVAKNFIKKDEEKPQTKSFNEQEQKNIIDEEINTTVKEDSTKNKEITQIIEIPEELYNGLKIEKITMNYIEETGLTLINFDIKNYGVLKNETNIPINLIDEEGKILTQTYISIQNLNTNQQTRVNIVIESDLRKTKKIEIRNEIIN